MLHAVAGHDEVALEWFERAAALSGAAQIGRYERDPRLSRIRAHPRFEAAVAAARARIERQRVAVEVWEAEERPYDRP